MSNKEIFLKDKFIGPRNIELAQVRFLILQPATPQMTLF